MAGLCATSDPIVGNNLDGARVQSGQGKERGLEGDQPTASHLSESPGQTKNFPLLSEKLLAGVGAGCKFAETLRR